MRAEKNRAGGAARRERALRARSGQRALRARPPRITRARRDFPVHLNSWWWCGAARRVGGQRDVESLVLTCAGTALAISARAASALARPRVSAGDSPLRLANLAFAANLTAVGVAASLAAARTAAIGASAAALRLRRSSAAAAFASNCAPPRVRTCSRRLETPCTRAYCARGHRVHCVHRL